MVRLFFCSLIIALPWLTFFLFKCTKTWEGRGGGALVLAIAFGVSIISLFLIFRVSKLERDQKTQKILKFLAAIFPLGVMLIVGLAILKV